MARAFPYSSSHFIWDLVIFAYVKYCRSYQLLNTRHHWLLCMVHTEYMLSNDTKIFIKNVNSRAFLLCYAVNGHLVTYFLLDPCTLEREREQKQIHTHTQCNWRILYRRQFVCKTSLMLVTNFLCCFMHINICIHKSFNPDNVINLVIHYFNTYVTNEIRPLLGFFSRSLIVVVRCVFCVLSHCLH